MFKKIIFFLEKYPKILHSLKVSLIESKGELRSWGELLYEYKINIDRKTLYDVIWEKKHLTRVSNNMR